MLDAERQIVYGLYRIRPNGNQPYPKGFIREDLSSMGHVSRVPPPPCTLSCTQHRCSSCTYSVCDLCRHCYYDSHRRHRRNRTEQHRKLGKLKHYYLDNLTQTGVFIHHKQGMQHSVAIKDRIEGSLPNTRPLLPCPLLSLNCSEKGLRNGANLGGQKTL